MPSIQLIDDAYLSRHRLMLGNPASSVAICALWKDLTQVKFSPKDLSQVSLIGNLYTARGINMLLRGLLRAPSIRHLVIWGPDTQHTGRSLVALWRDGLNATRRIADTEVVVDEEIPDQAVSELFRSVQVHDCREIRRLDSLMSQIAALPQLPPHADPRTFPEREPSQPETFPSLGTGWLVTAPKIAVGWTRALAQVARFGRLKQSQHNMIQRELLNVMIVITDEDPHDMFLPKYMPLARAELDEYLPRILSDFPADDLSYTYGNRLRGYFGRDQIASMIDQLRQAPHSRRAFAAMWDPRSDPERDTPPCLTQVALSVNDERLWLTYNARSQDMFAAWPQNTFAMRLLQAHAAAELGLRLGPITSQTVSAHIYEHDWNQAEHAAEQALVTRGTEFDPQGNFAIRVEDGHIEVELLHPNGQNIIWRTRGTESMAIGKQIATLGLASSAGHYVYLGRELQRAEEALKRGEVYDQGMA